MQALLPAIDANDEAKTLSCFRFFCVVLSSIPALEVRSEHQRSVIHSVVQRSSCTQAAICLKD